MSLLEVEGVKQVADVAITNLSSVAHTVLYTVPPGYSFIPVFAHLRAAGDVGANLAFTIGQHGAETDWIPVGDGDNLDAAGDVILIMAIPSATPVKLKSYPAGTVFEFAVTVAGNAVAGRVFLFAYLYVP